MKKIAICMSLLIGQAWGLSCTAPVTLSAPGLGVGFPNVVMNEEGRALITWTSRDLDTDEVKLVAATMNTEKKWSTAAISDSGKDISYSNIFVDTSGNILASWKLAKEDDEGKTSWLYQLAKQKKNKTWSPPINVLGQEEISWPKSVFDSHGNLVFFGIKPVKAQKDSWYTIYRVVSVNYSHQKGQKKETEIAKLENGHASDELLIRNKNDNFFALWTENTSTYDKMAGYTSERTMKGSWLNDATWSNPEEVFSVKTGDYFSDFSGIMNVNKDMVIVWDRKVGANSLHKVQALTYLDGQWSEPINLAESKEYIFSLGLSLSMNDKGHIVASWQRKQKGKKVVWIAEKPAGQSWSSSIPLTDPSEKSEISKVHIDEEGNIFVLWTKEGKNDIACFAEKSLGQPWSSPIALTDLSKDMRTLKMSKDKQGNILIVWAYREKGKGRKDIPYAIYRPVHQDWTTPVCLSDGLKSCDQIKLKTTSLGHFVVIWNEFSREEDRSSIHGAVLSTSTGEWSSALLSSPEEQDFDEFSFKLNNKGQGTIAWPVYNDDEDSYIQIAELKVD